MSIIITVRDYPALKTLLKTVAPGYRKHKAIATVTSHITPDGTSWEGGSRYGYLRVNLNTKTSRHMAAPSAPYQFSGKRPSDYRYKLAPHEIVIRSGMFCGKTATMGIYASLENYAKLGVIFPEDEHCYW